MASIAMDGEVSLLRLYALRVMYLLLVVGLGLSIVPGIVSHPLLDRGVIPSLLGAICLLALLGLRYPLQMLPLLMFELAWKTVWMISYGLPQWSAGQHPATFTDDFFAIALGVVIVPLVLPWGYIWRHYVAAPGARWR